MKEFYTISKNETAEIIEKKSKFIADIYPVKNVEEAENKIKEIKARYRLNNYRTHMIWRKKMGLSRKYDIYAYKELIAIIIPTNILVIYKKIKGKK